MLAKKWRAERRRKRARTEARRRGELTAEIVVWDAAGERWGGTVTASEGDMPRVIEKMAESVTDFFYTDPERQAEIGWTRQDA